MYQQYFGLTEQPFSIAVNPRYLFMSDRHRDALAHLLYGVGSGGGFILLTGEVGTGKTTLNRCLLEQLPEQTDIAIVLNPALSAVELLATVCDEFEIDYEQGTDSLKLLTDALHQFLLANHRANRRTVLMIDEAQHLGFEVLEQIRLLTNLETDEKKLLQIILTGQPELANLLKRPELRQLNQRITARFNLTPLDAEETAAYIQHRLRVAGLHGGRLLFSAAASKSVYRLSGGIPRLVNLLCDRALMGAYGRQADTVSASLVAEAATEVLGEGVPARSHVRRFGSLPKWGLPAAGLFLLAALAALPPMNSDIFEFLGSRQDLGRADQLEAVPDTAESLKPDSAIVAAERVAADKASAAPWLLSSEDAERALWVLWRRQPLVGRLCEAGAASGLVCERHQTEVWDVVLDHDRPAILELRRDTGFAWAHALQTPTLLLPLVIALTQARPTRIEKCIRRRQLVERTPQASKIAHFPVSTLGSANSAAFIKVDQVRTFRAEQNVARIEVVMHDCLVMKPANHPADRLPRNVIGRIRLDTRCQ